MVERSRLPLVARPRLVVIRQARLTASGSMISVVEKMTVTADWAGKQSDVDDAIFDVGDLRDGPSSS